jgi:hypothetical protein
VPCPHAVDVGARGDLPLRSSATSAAWRAASRHGRRAAGRVVDALEQDEQAPRDDGIGRGEDPDLLEAQPHQVVQGRGARHEAHLAGLVDTQRRGALAGRAADQDGGERVHRVLRGGRVVHARRQALERDVRQLADRERGVLHGPALGAEHDRAVDGVLEALERGAVRATRRRRGRSPERRSRPRAPLHASASAPVAADMMRAPRIVVT